MKQLFLLSLLLVTLACKQEKKQEQEPIDPELLSQGFVGPAPKPIEIIEFGYNLNDYNVISDTIESGDSFGWILEKNNVSHQDIYNIVQGVKDSVDIRKLQIGKEYTLLCSKDSLQTPQCFIYQPNSIDYWVIDFKDSIQGYKSKKPITLYERTASGVINSSLSETMDEAGLNYNLVIDLSTVYAWTIDFFRLQKGDRFKIIYDEKYINDTINVGIDRIKAAYFEHNGKPFYAFGYESDSIVGGSDYFDDKAKTLRKAFLKAPVEFSRVSSRYNLKRRIRYYGNRIRPHRGTDYAAAVGTPILATANGTVTKSSYTRGNGNYVKIRHNATYSTQYLHMKKRNVKKGQFVKQGEVIGWIGMTGNTSGPHVCYRFWKNGREVDPYKQKLPDAEPMKTAVIPNYLKFIAPIKNKLDSIQFPEEKEPIELDEITHLNQTNVITNDQPDNDKSLEKTRSPL